MLDLAKNNPAEIAEAGFEFEVVLPDGTVTDAKIKVRGTNSPAVRNFAKKSYTELQNKENRAKRQGKEYEMSVEEAEEFAVRSAAVRVISWSGIAENGVELESTPENINKVLTRYPFIRNQVMTESDNIFNFRHGTD